MNHSDHAGSPNSGNDFVATERFELVGNCRGRAMHVVEQFRIGVDVLAPSGDVGVQIGDAVDDGHWKSLRLELCAHTSKLWT